jgi:hypothetical protein
MGMIQFIASSSGTKRTKFLYLYMYVCIYIYIYIGRIWSRSGCTCSVRYEITMAEGMKQHQTVILLQKWTHRGDCNSDHAASVCLAAWFIEAFRSGSTRLSAFVGCSHTTAPLPRYIQHSSLMQETHVLRELYLLRQWHSSLYITSSKNTVTFLPHICKSFCIIYRVTQSHADFLFSDI